MRRHTTFRRAILRAADLRTAELAGDAQAMAALVPRASSETVLGRARRPGVAGAAPQAAVAARSSGPAALTLVVPALRALGGSLRPGDRVTVLATFESGAGARARAVARTYPVLEVDRPEGSTPTLRASRSRSLRTILRCRGVGAGELGGEDRPPARGREGSHGSDSPASAQGAREERPRVVIALTPVAERAVEHLVFGHDAVARVVASAPDAGDLEREVVSSSADGVLVSPDLSGLTTAHCARVRSHGVRLVGLARDSRERQQLHALGVDATVEPTDPPAEFVGALRGPTERASVEWQDRRDFRPVLHERPRRRRSRGDRNQGRPRSSECAASLAGLAGRWSCVLVELDALGGALDLRLGADPDEAPFSDSRGRPPERRRAGRASRSVVIETSGLAAGPRRRTGTRGGVGGAGTAGSRGADAARLASQFPLVIADVGFLLFEGDDASSACRVHREAVVTADAVLLVMGAREEQLQAGLDQLDSLLALGVPRSGYGSRSTAPAPQGRRPARSSTRSCRRSSPSAVSLDAWLPWDRRALARAQRTVCRSPRGAPTWRLCRALSGFSMTSSYPSCLLPEPKAGSCHPARATPSTPRRSL